MKMAILLPSILNYWRLERMLNLHENHSPIRLSKSDYLTIWRHRRGALCRRVRTALHRSQFLATVIQSGVRRYTVWRDVISYQSLLSQGENLICLQAQHLLQYQIGMLAQ